MGRCISTIAKNVIPVKAGIYYSKFGDIFVAFRVVKIDPSGSSELTVEDFRWDDMFRIFNFASPSRTCAWSLLSLEGFY